MQYFFFANYTYHHIRSIIGGFLILSYRHFLSISIL